MPSSLTRVLIVDDSRSYRAMLKSVLLTLDAVEVVGEAPDGRAALQEIERLRPDLVTLDLAMPVMDGLEMLRQLRFWPDPPAVVMLSALTLQGAEITIKALELGAFDFITKPLDSDHRDNTNNLSVQLRRVIDTLRGRRSGARAVDAAPAAGVTSAQGDKPSGGRICLVVIGVSTGGPQALMQVVPRLPQDFPVPVAIVQHMPPVFTAAFAQALDAKSPMRVLEGASGMALEPGTVYLAPGGRQMKVVAGAIKGLELKITDDPPEHSCRPAVDYLFRSVANLCADRTVAVIMTGMGKDGTLGLKLLKRQGARIIAQDESSCTVFGMPMEAIRAGVVDSVLPLERLAEEICRQVGAPALH